jgi:hypothetical protein
MIAASLAAAAAIAVGQAETPILLDNQCGEAEWADAAKTDVGQGVTLLAKADEDYVYLCWRLPPESLGTLDFYLIVPGEASRNMHVSAQVGDRWLGPDGWSEYAWGEHPGWFGPPVAFSGYETQADGSRVARFADNPAREIQISREISRAKWFFMFQMRAIGPGRAGELTWPRGGVPEDTRTWVELDLSE